MLIRFVSNGVYLQFGGEAFSGFSLEADWRETRAGWHFW